MNLFDTNILVYGYDTSEKEKRDKCFDILKDVFDGKEEGYVTNQILGELFYVLTQNMKKPLDDEYAKKIVDSFISSDNWKKINYNHNTLKKAMVYVRDYRIHFWDALIASTMIDNNILVIYTENEKDFKKIPGIKVINPFVDISE